MWRFICQIQHCPFTKIGVYASSHREAEAIANAALEDSTAVAFMIHVDALRFHGIA